MKGFLRKFIFEIFIESFGHIQIFDKLDKNNEDLTWIPMALYCLSASVFVLETDCLLCDVIALADETVYQCE